MPLLSRYCIKQVIMSKIDLSSIGQTKEVTFKYDWKACALYNLGIGAQAEHLSFVYERVQGGIKVYPSFATIVALQGLFFPHGTDLVRLLHGEQLIRLLKKCDCEILLNA